MEQNPGVTLSKDEIDIIGEVWNIGMGSAATALSNIIGETVNITSPHVEIANDETIRKVETIPSVGVKISFTTGICGDDLLIVRKKDVSRIVAKLMGEEPGDEESEFGEMQLSAISEVMNQMIGSAATALSNMLKKKVNISPPEAFLLTEDNIRETMKALNGSSNVQVLIRFLFKVEGLFESELYTVLTFDAAQEIIAVMLSDMETENAKTASPEPQQDVQQQPPQQAPQYPAPGPETPRPQPRQAAPYTVAEYGQAAIPPQRDFGQMPNYSSQPQKEAAAAYGNAVPLQENVRKTQVHPLQMQNFDEPVELAPAEVSNFGLIEDVPLDISVEVGRARKMVKDIIDLSSGSIIELDKQAGDPVDIIVNGQLIAKGEVVVIDESFGVRITEIVNKKSKDK